MKQTSILTLKLPIKELYKNFEFRIQNFESGINYQLSIIIYHL